jgi:hypothetical protein
MRWCSTRYLSPEEGFAYWADWHWYAGKLFF